MNRKEKKKEKKEIARRKKDAAILAKRMQILKAERSELAERRMKAIKVEQVFSKPSSPPMVKVKVATAAEGDEDGIEAVNAVSKPPMFVPRRYNRSCIILCTSAPVVRLGTAERKTGVWLEELATPYYALIEAGIVPIIASVLGGPIPIDSGSIEGKFFTESSKKFLHDKDAIEQMSHSVSVSSLVTATDADGLYVAGGHGACEDLYDDDDARELVEEMSNAGKIIAADCHGQVVFTQCVQPDGIPFVQGKRVTGFSNLEEEQVGMDQIIPFSLEDRFVDQGGHYSCGDPWTSHVEVDGNLITGQNPQSSYELSCVLVNKILRKENTSWS